MTLKKLFILFFLSPLQLLCQEITGIVKNSETKQPVEYATVYINGTTNGTITNRDGIFKLENVQYPCQLVVSHVSYSLKMYQLDDSLHLNFEFFLEPRVINIDEVMVKESNLRNENLELFKKEFFGNDVWGRNAQLINEDDLIFKVEYFSDNEPKKNLIGKPKSFVAESKNPLKISLPVLGYDLHYDLVSFSQQYYPELDDYKTLIIGYSSFRPFQVESKSKTRKYRRNRLVAYYNSRLHFCRSLIENKLPGNGYQLFSLSKNGLYHKAEFNEDSILTIQADSAVINGLKGRHYSIGYYSNFRGFPISPENYYGRDKPEFSDIYFLNDEAVIRKDGTKTGESVIFGGVIGNKKNRRYFTQ